MKTGLPDSFLHQIKTAVQEFKERQIKTITRNIATYKSNEAVSDYYYEGFVNEFTWWIRT